MTRCITAATTAMAAVLLKPSEYQGANGTAVAGRIVICSKQSIEPRGKQAAASAPAKGRGGKGKQGKTATSGPSTKLELHLSATDSTSEVLYVEAWAEIAERLSARCRVGDIVSLAGGTVINNVQTYSTSKLHYYLRLKGVLDMHIQMVKLDVLPWGTPSETHPLVPLRALDRVRDKQQICVSGVVVENPGSVERQTSNGPAAVCNAVVQDASCTRVRCAFWREAADSLAAYEVGACVLLYQVLVTKKSEDRDSWELGSWRGTQILDCPDDLADSMFLVGNIFFLFYLFFVCSTSSHSMDAFFCYFFSHTFSFPCITSRSSLRLRTKDLATAEECRMLTEIPIKNWETCPAVATSLSSLLGVIVPGEVRKVDAVFEAVGLQVMCVTSVRTDTDEWILKSCVKCKRAAPCQARMRLYSVLNFSCHPTFLYE